MQITSKRGTIVTPVKRVGAATVHKISFNDTNSTLQNDDSCKLSCQKLPKESFGSNGTDNLHQLSTASVKHTFRPISASNFSDINHQSRNENLRCFSNISIMSKRNEAENWIAGTPKKILPMSNTAKYRSDLKLLNVQHENSRTADYPARSFIDASKLLERNSNLSLLNEGSSKRTESPEKRKRKWRYSRRAGYICCCSPCCCLCTGIIIAFVLVGLATILAAILLIKSPISKSVSPTVSSSVTPISTTGLTIPNTTVSLAITATNASTTDSTTASTFSSNSTVVNSSSTGSGATANSTSANTASTASAITTVMASTTNTTSTATTSITATSQTTGTTTTTAATITITLNSCTSGWKGITGLYHCFNNCPIQNSYTQYTYTYVAISNKTRITFALRQDNYYFGLDNISVWDNAAPSNQLIANGGFETGNLNSWNYCNPNGASYAGTVQKNSYSYSGNTYSPYSGSYFYFDGAVNNPDYLSQTFSTIIGSIYTISFWFYNPKGTSGVSVDILISF